MKHIINTIFFVTLLILLSSCANERDKTYIDTQNLFVDILCSTKLIVETEQAYDQFVKEKNSPFSEMSYENKRTFSKELRRIWNKQKYDLSNYKTEVEYINILIQKPISEQKDFAIEAAKKAQKECSEFTKDYLATTGTAMSIISFIAKLENAKEETDAPAWFNKGIELSKLGRHDEALTAFNRALEIDPGHSNPWYNKGMTLAKLGRYDESITAFDKALEINPDHALAWHNKGISFYHLVNYDAAIIAFNRTLEIDPDDAGAYYNLACLNSIKGKKNTAYKNLAKAIELDKSFKEMAKSDADFKNIRDDDEYKELIK